MSVSLIIYHAIHTLINPKTAKACFGVLIPNSLIIHWLYHGWSSSNSRSIYYVIKVMCLHCNIIAIGDTLYEYELIWSQLSTNRFVSPRASESALSYTHQGHNGLIIVANDSTLNFATPDWSQIYSDLKLSSVAIYRTESIPRHSGQMNPKSYLPRHRVCGQTKGWFVLVHSVNRTPIYRLSDNDLSLIWPCISRNAMVVWYWPHLISLGMNNWSMSK